MFISTIFPRRQIRLSSRFLWACKTYVVSSSADPPPISPLSEPPKEHQTPDRTPETIMSVPRLADVQTLRPSPLLAHRFFRCPGWVCIVLGESNRPPATLMPSLDRNIKRGDAHRKRDSSDSRSYSVEACSFIFTQLCTEASSP